MYRFDSNRALHTHGDHGVVGSTTDCDPVGGGFERARLITPLTPVAQWREHSSDTRVVAGSACLKNSSSRYQPVVVQSGPEPLSASRESRGFINESRLPVQPLRASLAQCQSARLSNERPA